MNTTKSEENLLIMDPYTTESYMDYNFSLTLRETSSHYVNASEREVSNSISWLDLALVSLFCSIIAGTVAGNALVIAAVVTTRRLRTVTNCFVMSLAVADWLVGMFVMPPKVALFLVKNEWKMGKTTCELWISLDVLLCTASILSLCAISIDRYLAITRPLAYSRRRRSKRLALSMISCVWVAAVIITSPPHFGLWSVTIPTTTNLENENQCKYIEDKGYVVYSALGSFFIPLLVMLYVYARIACVIAHRQKTMQKLSNSDRFDSTKSTNNVEEPLRQNVDVGVEMVRHRGRSGVSAAEPEATATTGFGGDHQRLHTSPSTSSSTTHNPNTNQSHNSSFWEKLGLSSCSCTKGSSNANNGRGKHDRNQRSFASGTGHRGGTAGSSDSETNSATIAISVPHPSTLAGSMTEGVSGVVTEGAIATSGTSPGSLHRYHHHQFSRMRTGSRLCHHSVATTSPQRSVHRVHQTTSASGRIFSDEEIVPMCGSNSLSMNSRLEAPRVWTVEETTSTLSSLGANRSKSLSSNGRLDSLSPSELDTRRGSFSLGRVGSSRGAHPSSSISPGISAPNIAPSGDNGSGRLANRVYQPQTLHAHHSNNHGTSQQSGVNVSRRSIKLNANVHDQNQNSREFMSGRVASFKRETKTARTLAAVVGGFIICWLPFFVAYVIEPFMPSKVSIPEGLMDALIWLGWGNSAINPLIYSFYSADFRSAFWRLTIHKCEGLVRNNPGRCSPRRYDDNTQLRISA